MTSQRLTAVLWSCAAATLWISRVWAGPTVSFANDVQPIFDARCVRCHSGNAPTGGLDLTAGQAHDNLVNQPTSDGCMATAPDSVRVVPFDPPSSMLWLKLLPDD